ncbi:glycerol uptake facilitator protein-like isoform X2 [Hylaeus volcanicus]|uniref:glycerol uptake facilitator protein-like isoform X2 n=1 Tax=Hylaeus volcanicus TaxID=313075 RepID=UPI0023B7E5CB|nr:glycerol uptake facilitator protein-like isoform X2 [Hylaeus volcanicus]
MSVGIEPTSTAKHPPQISWLHTAFHEAVAEAFGTFILILLGTGSGGGRLTGSIADDWETGTMWSIGIISGTYGCGFVSGAHMNPAISIAMVVAGYMPLWKIFHYTLGQLIGGIAASALVYTFYYDFLDENLASFHNGSIESAYLQNSGIFSCKLHTNVSTWRGVYIEAVLTGLLVIVVSFVGDPYSILKKYPFVSPFIIALFVGGLISSFGSLTSACLNPIRDLSPRIVMFFFGWGESAFPGIDNRNKFWIFILGPMIGGVVGSLFWKMLGSYLYEYSAKQRSLLQMNSTSTDESRLLENDHLYFS